jgi:hypothetical protein
LWTDGVNKRSIRSPVEAQFHKDIVSSHPSNTIHYNVQVEVIVTLIELEYCKCKQIATAEYR